MSDDIPKKEKVPCMGSRSRVDGGDSNTPTRAAFPL